MGIRDEYIKYRFQRAEETYDDAIILAEKEKWNSAINRLYYACFYVDNALLLKNQIKTRTHDGARTQFGLEFVKEGKIDKKYGRLYSKLFDFRQKGDYGDLFDFNREDVEPLIPQVYEFLKELKKVI